ncbi:glycoside hydrolase family 5 protein [uncultured Zobellia sp.]|uniref:glycoside hydrolase family 5 protein n=1 Tax=uncultured Zobellia sp. TaxID=255433 RepID=UPI0025963D2E|nr:glycoside hydrolase family 5 protein [uncultured Zobellia sp.]
MVRFRKILKKGLVCTALVVAMASFGQSPKQMVSNQFTVEKGTNVAHWLSQSERRGEERKRFFTKSDIRTIANMGFDHIRLPIDEEQMWDENLQRHHEAFQLLENCIQWSVEYNLKVIVDLHILRSHHFNAKEKPLWTDKKEQEKFFDLWRDLSKALSKYPNSLLAYELMNEAVADDNESWNELLENACNTIRELEPQRTIVIGSNRWQSVETFDELRVPEGDKNILLSFHFYKPFLLSHYGASWTDLNNYEGPVHYPGVILTKKEFQTLPDTVKPSIEKWAGEKFDKTVLLDLWKKPIEKAKLLGLPLYCGEFGIIEGAPEEDALAWYKDMLSLFSETGIGYANWNYKSDNFGLVSDDGTPDQELIDVIMNKK